MAREESNLITDEVINALNNQNRSIDSIARESGVGASTIRGWLNNGKTPTLQNAQWVLKVLGYNIAIIKIEERNDGNGQ